MIRNISVQPVNSIEKEAANQHVDPGYQQNNGKSSTRTTILKILLHFVAIVCLIGAGIGIGYAIFNKETTTDTISPCNNNNTASVPSCDVSEVNLSALEVWKREEGYWYGEYTFLGADGNPYVSKNWNYHYAHYYGFIHLQLIGNSLKQRNVFVYPPQSNLTCASTNNSTLGSGSCGINGNEKIFSADQKAIDCEGNLAGPFPYGPYTLDTSTRTMNDDTVVYKVTLPASLGGGINQNQLTTLPGNGIRVRTAQGFAAGQPSYASFYREYKQASRADWVKKLQEIRRVANILTADECGYLSSNVGSGTNCTAHFGFAV